MSGKTFRLAIVLTGIAIMPVLQAADTSADAVTRVDTHTLEQLQRRQAKTRTFNRARASVKSGDPFESGTVRSRNAQ